MVTHDDHLAQYADRIFHIIDGKIVKIEDNRKQKEREERVMKLFKKAGALIFVQR